MLELTSSPRGVLLRVRVTPRSSRNTIDRVEAGELRVRLSAPPVEGKANQALMTLLAGALGVPPRDVALVSGGTARHKLVAIKGLSVEEVRRRLAATLGPATSGGEPG